MKITKKLTYYTLTIFFMIVIIFFMIVIPFFYVQSIQSFDSDDETTVAQITNFNYDNDADTVALYDDNDDDMTIAEQYNKIDKETLFAAVDNDDYELTKYLIDKNPDLVNCQDREGSTPLFYAVGYGDERIVDLLLESGAQPDLADYNGDTPLRVAVDFNQYEAAQLLLRHGANFALRNNKGESPFGQANREMEDIFLAHY